MDVKDFSYHLPEELVAKYPSHPRDASRLLVLKKTTGEISHQYFSNIVDHFQAGDVLVLNNTRVFPCRLLSQRKTGGRQEILLINSKFKIRNSKQIQNREKKQHEIWNIIVNASQRVRAGDRFDFDGLSVTILSGEGNEREAELAFEGDLFDVLEKIGHVPLPPYINRPDQDSDRQYYQTVYAKETGSVAAPTAGLHFTQGLLHQLRQKGVEIVFLTLHVGPGTFLPVRTKKVEDHKMHAEFYSVSAGTCQTINRAKAEGRRITAVGTTSARVLESLALKSHQLKPETGWTDIFIYPPFTFKIVDRLITNFHLPESTLLMLVSAFVGRKSVLAAYQEAIYKKYRFYSYGDAMMIC
jgi:S-adenosylmethionine:tRNA ribosyltransferase-isomerase